MTYLSKSLKIFFENILLKFREFGQIWITNSNRKHKFHFDIGNNSINIENNDSIWMWEEFESGPGLQYRRESTATTHQPETSCCMLRLWRHSGWTSIRMKTATCVDLVWIVLFVFRRKNEQKSKYFDCSCKLNTVTREAGYQTWKIELIRRISKLFMLATYIFVSFVWRLALLFPKAKMKQYADIFLIFLIFEVRSVSEFSINSCEWT